MDHAGCPRRRVSPHLWRMFWGRHISSGRGWLSVGRLAGTDGIASPLVAPWPLRFRITPLDVDPFYQLEERDGIRLLSLRSEDGTNRLSRRCVLSLTEIVRHLASEKRALVIAGNSKFFSAGAELEEIAALDGPTAYEFAKMGQALMAAIEGFPAPVYAAVSGYCMGGGLDLALACHRRIASPHAILGHRGAALGLITGWGGTQRLPRLIGKGRAWKCS